MIVKLTCIQMFGAKELEYTITDANGFPIMAGCRVPFTHENSLAQWQALCEFDAGLKFSGANEPIETGTNESG